MSCKAQYISPVTFHVHPRMEDLVHVFRCPMDRSGSCCRAVVCRPRTIGAFLRFILCPAYYPARLSRGASLHSLRGHALALQGVRSNTRDASLCVTQRHGKSVLLADWMHVRLQR